MTSLAPAMKETNGDTPGSLPTGRRTQRRNKRSPLRILVHVTVIVLTVIWFTPVLALFTTSLRTQKDVAANGWWMAFIQPRLTGFNYQQALDLVGIGPSIATSLAISIPTTIMTTVFSALGAYALTRMSFKGRTSLSLLLVALLVIPPQVTLVPLLRLFQDMGLNGSVPAVWLYQVGFTVPFGIFLLRGFMASIPQELFESAAIDGATPLRIFRTMVLPLSVPVMVSLAIMAFLWSWNDLLVPLLFLGGSDLANPLTVQVAGLAQTTGQGEAAMMAATFISIIVPLTVIVSLQRFFVRGILGGAVKG
ncbi:carbohydrate ABC transporter permease [Pseudarthrobacter sp. LMD1-1-1.1]|uniref:carbohydrate ABC transporter permease n=1 Tax=Pseudarthrobacter sp. LMD1-1-1.1 TaxID=3135242 RepID=UPI0034208225